MLQRPRPTHVVALLGRLGNQLFQVALAEWLGERGCEVSFDLSCHRAAEPDVYRVPHIGADIRARSRQTTRAFPTPMGRAAGSGRILRLALGPRRVVVDLDPIGGELRVDAGVGTWWFGYWQRLIFAQALLPTLRSAMRNDIRSARSASGAGPVIRVHIRRGDYAGNLMALPLWWYADAVQVARQSAVADARVIVTSDDADWCRAELDLNCEFSVEGGESALSDMALLASADVLVTSRSTYSWWAANLCDGIVVTPRPWFPDSPARDGLLVPSAWLPVGLSNV